MTDEMFFKVLSALLLVAPILANTTDHPDPPQVQICDAKLNGTRLTVSPCYDRVTIVTESGSFTIPCDSLPSAVFFGRVHITTGDFRCTADANPFCEPLIDQGPHQLNCRSRWHPGTWTLIGMSTLIILAPLTIWRYQWVKRNLKKSKMPSSRSESTNEGLFVTWEEDEGMQLISGRMQPSVAVRRERVPVWRVLLLVLMFWSPPVVPKPVTIQMLNTDFATMPGCNVSVNDFHWDHTLQELYTTFNYTLRVESDWHCSEGKCNKHGECGQSSLTGVSGENYLWAADWDNKRHNYIRWCEPTREPCLVVTGCWKWLVDISIDPREPYLVSRVLPPLLRHNVRVEGEKCKLVNVKSQEPVDLTKFTHILSKDGELLCPVQDNYGMAKAGSLGDLQVNKAWRYLYDTNSLLCKREEGKPPACSLPLPGINRVLSLCSPLPATSSGVTTLRLGSHLLSRVTSPLEVTINLDSEISFDTHPCGGVTMELVGHKDSPLGQFVIVETKMKRPNRMWIGDVPCQPDPVNIPCVSGPITYPIYEGCTGNSTFNKDSRTVSDVIEPERYFHPHPLKPPLDSEDLLVSMIQVWVKCHLILSIVLVIGAILLLRALWK